MDIDQLRVGKGYLKENLTELHIIVRTTGYVGYNHQKILDKAVAECKLIGIFRLKGISSVEYFNVQ